MLKKMDFPYQEALTEAQLVVQFFEYLSQRGLRYAVQGNYNKIPSNIDGDVDIVVDSVFFNTIPGLLLDFCLEKHVYLTQIMRHEVTAIYASIAWHDTDGKLTSLNLDICSDYMYSGTTYLSSAELLRGRILYDTSNVRFYICGHQINYEYYLLKKILKGDQQKSGQDFLEFLIDKHSPEELLISSTNMFGVEEFFSSTEEISWDKVNKFIYFGSRWKNRRYIKNLPKELIRIFNRICWPSGLIVGFLGADGSGKTTLIKKSVESLSPCFRRTDYFHLRPRMLHRGAQSSPVMDPHGLSPRQNMASILKLAYFFVDFWIGFCSIITFYKTKSSLVIFDRYFHDLFIDPKRYRIKLPSCYARFVAAVIPLPDLWIFPTSSAQVIQSRKTEVNEDECKRQVKAYRALASKLDNAVVVEASTSINKSALEMESHILSFLHKRVIKRLKLGVL